jgi:leader peptidase (prepilin peptidase)/N-methyltransferase
MPPETLFFAPPATLAAAIAAAVFGLLIGSFLNVVVHRLPIMRQRELENYLAHEAGKPLPHTDTYNLMVPRSACPHCGHPIGALENIPIVSWLALGGKCRACRKPISARYPVVEAVTGVLSALLVWHFGSGWLGLATLVFAYLLIAMTLIDIDHKELPDDLTYPLLWTGLLVNLNGSESGFVPLRDAVIGAVAGYMSLWLVARTYQLVRKRPGMGEGDFKLLAALGAWLGWKMLPAVILLSSGVGAVLGVAMIVLRRMDKGDYIPFGPYLAGAGMIALFYGGPLARLMQFYFP